MNGSNQPGDKPHRPKWVRHLSDEDARILDALLAATNRDPDAAGTAQQHHPERVQRVRTLLTLLDQMPEQTDDPQLVQRTLDTVQAAQIRERFVEQSEMGGAPMSRVGLRQVAVIALMFVLGGSLLLPVLERNRSAAERVACAANLRLAGESMHRYAHDHRQVLPRGKVQPGATWWNVGRTARDESEVVQSNSAHLYKLVRQRYIQADTLACPSNPNAPAGQMSPSHRDWNSPEEVSYSYQNQYTEHPWRVDQHHDLAVLADRNPLFVSRSGRVIFDQSVPTDAPSRGHARRGQNVLSVDGTVEWTIRPYRPHVGQRSADNPDNIWIANGIKRYTGTERPHDGDDSFLVP